MRKIEWYVNLTHTCDMSLNNSNLKNRKYYIKKSKIEQNIRLSVINSFEIHLISQNYQSDRATLLNRLTIKLYQEQDN